MDEADGVGIEGTGWEELLPAAIVALDVGTGMPGRRQGRGTGFFVAPGIIVTCAHVLAGDETALPEEIAARSVRDGRQLRLRVCRDQYFRDDSGLDLAFLEVVAETDASDLPYVLVSPVAEIGDRLWTYGHPDGRFRAGQPATLRYEGRSRRSEDDQLTLPRVHGTPVSGGTSGSPVVNLRTGAVCGMLCTSDSAGSAHLLPIEEIVERSSVVQQQLTVPAVAYESWLRLLTDAQLWAGGWPFPGPRLRAYLRAAAESSQRHPYPGVVPGNASPPLSQVYVQQSAQAGVGDADVPRSARTLPAIRILDDDGDSLLVGTAGAGKSSLFHAAVIELAAQWKQAAASAAPVRVQAAELVPGRPLPEALAVSVAAELGHAGPLERWPAGFFADPPVPGGKWLVLIDGLDELMNVEQRRAVLGKLAAVRDSDGGRHYQFIVAMRPLPDGEVAFEVAWQPARYELLPFAGKQFERFAIGWFARLGVKRPRQSWQQFVAQLDSGGLEELAGHR